ncbi:Exonuclease V - a 5' deoxyribonuclease domain containing protein [Naviculisporaceae sp. PSN 640]
MARRESDSDSDSSYGYDFTAEDEELISALVDRVARSPQPPRAPALLQNLASTSASPAQTSAPVVDPALLDISEDDLDFDLAELESNFTVNPHPPAIPPKPAVLVDESISDDVPNSNKRRLSPSLTRDLEDGHSSLAAKTKPHHPATPVDYPNVQYPDISRALSAVTKPSEPSKAEEEGSGKAPIEEQRSPLRRFRTFPRKPFSVSDLTAGAWCELQYYYTLTRLPGGKKTRTEAMKRGSEVHTTLEREVYTPVVVETVKKEDAWGLRIWNIIQGLRTLRDTGLTRELEVWGVVDGNVVNGVIDVLSYQNPDPELEEDVISSRGNSQSPPGSQQKVIGVSEFFPAGTPSDRIVYITDVKTRASKTPPSKVQVRGTIIQLFLYHRFLSEMASDKLDYIALFERYALNPDEPFSDLFMAQIASLHEEIFGSEEDSSSSASWRSESSDSEAPTDYHTAVSTTSKLNVGDEKSHKESLKYRSLRALIPLLKFEIQLTFPKGASSVGPIVAVQYRYRQRGRATSGDDEVNNEDDERRNGKVICTNSHFVEPSILDLYLKDDMQWWRGEREPRGVPLDEAFKCRSCEFVDSCEWRDNLDQEAIRKARKKTEARGGKVAPSW